MNAIERPVGTRNATILMILAGVLEIYAGYSFHQIAIIMTYPLNSIFGTFMIGLGVLSLCTSLLVWFENSWAQTMIIGAGLAVCVTLLIFGFYTVIVIFAAIYYVAWKQLGNEIENTEWFDAEYET